MDSPFAFAFKPPPKNPHPLLKLDDCAVGYDDTAIVRHAKLVLNPGDRIGLLGPNGAGKSTLIKLLAGDLAPLAGERAEARHLAIGYFAQHQLEQLQPGHSPLEHLQQLDRDASEQALRDYLGGFGFIGDKALEAVAPFSGGEKSRLVLALLVYRRPNLLLLDEPTNHLDLEMRQALATALQDFEGAMSIIQDLYNIYDKERSKYLARKSSQNQLLIELQRNLAFIREGLREELPQKTIIDGLDDQQFRLATRRNVSLAGMV